MLTPVGKASSNASQRTLRLIANFKPGMGLAVAAVAICSFLLSCAQDADNGPSSLTHSAADESRSKADIVFEVSAPSDNLERDSKPSYEQRSGRVMAVFNNDCGIADPAIDEALGSRAVYTLPLVSEIHAGLMKIGNEDGRARIEPELAAGYSVGDNGLTYSFDLHKGLKFSDGSPLTASDVKWSWERALKLSTGRGRANDVFGWIKGADAVASSKTDELVGVEIIDDHRLQVSLIATRSDFLMLLADPVASVLRRENVENWRYTWSNEGGSFLSTHAAPEDSVPVGAGPFKLADYAPVLAEEGQKCTLVRNDHYWGRPAYLDGVIFDSVLWSTADQSMGFDEFMKRAYSDEKIDYRWFGQNDPSETESGKAFLQGRIERMEGPVFSTFLIFNPAHPPFDDVNFRRALVAASDIERMFGVAPIPWKRRLVPQIIAPRDSALETKGFDPDTARSELTQSRYVDTARDFQVEFVRDSYGTFTDFYLELFRSWNDVLGFSVEIHTTEHPSEFDDLLHSGELRFREIETDALYPDPYAILRTFVSPFGADGSHEEIERIGDMLAEAVGEGDAAERSRRYEAIEGYILGQAIALPILSSGPTFEIAVQSYVHGFEILPYPGSAFHNVWLDETAPERALP